MCLSLAPSAPHGKSLVSKKPAAKPHPSGKKPKPPDRLIAENRRARHEYTVLETLECGLVLVGSEVKSLRQGKVSLEEAYGRVKDGEVFLLGCDIAEYVEANRFNHNPRRPRKLLLHRREIKKFASQAFQKGFTLVPLKLYFKEGRAKILLGVCKGRQLHDKREVMKQKTARREMDRALRHRGRGD